MPFHVALTPDFVAFMQKLNALVKKDEFYPSPPPTMPDWTNYWAWDIAECFTLDQTLWQDMVSQEGEVVYSQSERKERKASTERARRDELWRIFSNAFRFKFPLKFRVEARNRKHG